MHTCLQACVHPALHTSFRNIIACLQHSSHMYEADAVLYMHILDIVVLDKTTIPYFLLGWL